MKKKKENLSCSRLGKVGGQAVLEGVMMRSGDRWCLAVRESGGGIAKRNGEYVSLRKKNKFCNIPIIRGVINFVEMLRLSMSMLTASAEMIGVETDEPESKFEKWVNDKFGDKIMGIVTAIGSVLGVVLSVGLFIFLPTFVTKLILGENQAAGTFQPLRSLIEGILKIAIFVLYIFLVGLMPDIKRTFKYHGAEHKSVACYEKGLDLTPENAKPCTRFHPRCGTSFIFVMLILSIVIGIFIPFNDMPLLRTAAKILVLPITVGLGFEFIMYAGRHNNVLVKILSAPGLWMQRLTTKEPDESMLEVAIAALKGAIPDEFPPEESEEGTEEVTEAEEISTNAENEIPSSETEEETAEPDGEDENDG
ncbi:MAG: DUF1385 domain-containing protein [Clostridia bacterium]|nr:DUF1385 domain-containing protein [Clostridia bacterium]MBR7033327.1 DUF1385 domain-containing protein [Clostridia bacterium]